MYWAASSKDRRTGQGLDRTINCVQILPQEALPPCGSELLYGGLEGTGDPSLDQLAHFCRGLQVYEGYLDDPRNTDNAWIETVAVSIHFQDQNDTELKRLEEV